MWLYILAVVLLVIFFLMPSSSVDKEGFLNYIVYGPDFYGGWGGPGGWPYRYRYRPYWGWRRRYWHGPCPGPWCPYSF